ncbi:ABC transporter ATP-binding protein [Streptomyces griseorubiginosus]|uniref:Daunorubicin/doxorubicin resistance ATP-binding protein DrrA n=1 Tax=Streptomyces griseorubiginosus TaxID=67304 RepID=A0AAI8L9R4_9ACTN|nr:ABC transporter ATP-binding protein [Streptomyces griseorubiginosus]AYC43694.1 Daunorubicin/doxorubicin resistance ATP-binding protein DrrA [Streptomyces griseorubiginosus]
MLVTNGLVKSYGRHRALDGFDLTVEPGEIVGLIGHNGAGKTTFVEIVTGLVRPDAGSVRIGPYDALSEGRDARRLVGVAPQELALYGSVTVRENLRLLAGLAGLRGRRRDAGIARVLEELQLSAVADRPVGILSGGQRRRVQAATAMVGSPPLLLLDEPTAGADPETRSALLAAVRARAEAGAAVVYTTHYLPELVDLDATLAIARAGRVIARGTQEELTRHLPGELRVTFADPAEPELRTPTTDPGADLAALLASGRTPASVDVHRPGLDDLYHSLETTTPEAGPTEPTTQQSTVAQAAAPTRTESHDAAA